MSEPDDYYKIATLAALSDEERHDVKWFIKHFHWAPQDASIAVSSGWKPSDFSSIDNEYNRYSTTNDETLERENAKLERENEELRRKYKLLDSYYHVLDGMFDTLLHMGDSND